MDPLLTVVLIAAFITLTGWWLLWHSWRLGFRGMALGSAFAATAGTYIAVRLAAAL